MSAAKAVRRKVSEIREYLTEAVGAFLGLLCWWELSDARVGRQRLVSLWSGAGLDAALLPEAPTADRSLRQAIEAQGLRGTGILVRESLRTPAECCYEVVEERARGDGTNSYHSLSVIRLDRKTGTCTPSTSHSVARAIVSEYGRLRDTHSSDEVRVAVTRVVREQCQGASLRRHGGFYWVPSAGCGTLQALAGVVEQIGSSAFQTLPIHESPATVKAVSAGAQDSLRTELADLHKSIEGYLTKPAKRTSTYETRLEELAALRDRASLYQSVLSVEVSDLEQGVADLESKLQQMIDNADEEA